MAGRVVTAGLSADAALKEAHGLKIVNDVAYTTDRPDSVAMSFTLDGRPLLVLGKRGVHSDTGAVKAWLVERAGGHAFYLEELVRVVAAGVDDTMPETVLAMVQARLEALDPEARRVLRAASIFGQTFWLSGVHALVGGKVVIKPGETIEGATIVIRNGLIEAVGKNVSPPADARIWDTTGLTIYAGFIESYLPVGQTNQAISTSETDRDGIVVTVSDSGPGLDPANPERVFEAFYTTKPGGVGMGLLICRSIIEAHGGRLQASANIPRGATFQFTIPVRGEGAASRRVAANQTVATSAEAKEGKSV